MYIVSIRVQPMRGDPPACGLGEALFLIVESNMLRNGIQGTMSCPIVRQQQRKR